MLHGLQQKGNELMHAEEGQLIVGRLKDLQLSLLVLLLQDLHCLAAARSSVACSRS